jgi:hypothetical protein
MHIDHISVCRKSSDGKSSKNYDQQPAVAHISLSAVAAPVPPPPTGEQAQRSDPPPRPGTLLVY